MIGNEMGHLLKCVKLYGKGDVLLRREISLKVICGKSKKEGKDQESIQSSTTQAQDTNSQILKL